MTPMVWPSSMTPEFTRPTSITVMADEDWMAMVMPAPSKRLLTGLEVMRLSSRSSLPPAIFSRLLDMVFIPYRKKASPPQSVKTEKISMRFSLSNSDHEAVRIRRTAPSHSPIYYWFVSANAYDTSLLYMQKRGLGRGK